MKVGTLLRGTQNKDWGVVYKNDGRKIHIFWHKREYKEKLSIQFLNKCIAANLIEVIEIKEKSNEQETSREESQTKAGLKTEEEAEKYK
tara:strand:+ start:217 stop:483 length:267 start_codon:yes stop_codon:yes gene_type:complete